MPVYAQKEKPMITNSIELEKPRPVMGDQLKGRVAIVTGAGSGLGKAIAEALAREGVAVVVNDIDTESGMAVTQGIIGAGGEAVFHYGDVSQVKDVMSLIHMTVDRYTRIDILVNNAGLQHIAPIAEFTEEKWNQLIGVMLTGPFLTTKYAFPHMMAQRKGRIINISSTQGLVSAEFKAAYVSAKHGVIGLTKVTALGRRAAQHYRRRRVPLLCAHAAGGKANRRASEVSWHDRAGSGRENHDRARRSETPAGTGRGRGPGAVPRDRCGAMHHRFGSTHRLRLDGAVGCTGFYEQG